MAEQYPAGASVPESRTTPPKHSRFSVVWIIPVVAALAGSWVAVTRIMNQGPQITIQFATAEGLEAGKTKLHFNGVDVGTVSGIRLADDNKHVVLQVQMEVNTQRMLVEDTRFWVVSPRISGANVSGLNTLISGAYIGLEIGHSTQSRREFIGLDVPPIVAADTPGHFFVLKAAELGSLGVGAPIYYRRLEAGQVVSYDLDKNGQALTVRVFIRAPYDQYVNANTRFWHASGVDVSLTAAGLMVDTQSMLSILAGGVAFENPESDAALPEAPAESQYTLYHTRADAFRPPPGNPRPFRFVFHQSVRGLAVGAPVEFRGIPVGDITSIESVLDANKFEFYTIVTTRVDLGRLGLRIVGVQPGEPVPPARRAEVIRQLVAHGMRAQLRSSSMLTGALYVAVDFYPDAPPARVDTSKEPIELPTIKGEFEETEVRIASIVRKLDELPLAQIGSGVQRTITDLDATIVAAQATLKQADAIIDRAGQMVEPDSVLGVELNQTLGELRRAAQELRALTDSLNRHPEALLHGKPGEPYQEKK
jgi:paraquat-inducible protein B